jgi:heme o synthase
MSTASQTITVSRGGFSALVRDYSELTKARITSLIVMTAWSGFYMAAAQSGADGFSWRLANALLGIGLASSGTAALNQVLEVDLDARMRRTARRPLVTGRMSLRTGLIAGIALIVGGVEYLAFTTNLLTAFLTLATAAVYLGAYTPLKRIHPLCTFIGAFPGAMPPVLGWTAIRGRLDWEALALFAILFFWQFPHFHSIGWLYREDYERARIRMLPVVETDGSATSRSILLYSMALIPASIAPVLLGMTGLAYLFSAVLLGGAFLLVALRLVRSRMSPAMAESKKLARNVLQASVIYLPLLFAIMMIDAAR